MTQIHNGLTETVRTVQKTRPRNGKEPCFTILSAIIGVKGTNVTVGRGGVGLVSLRYVSGVQAFSRGGRFDEGRVRMAQDCSALR